MYVAKARPDKAHASESVRAREHNPALDGLRGVAFLLVFLLHTIVLPEDVSPALRGFLDLGRLGVDLFFCLSGFLITRILVAAKYDRHYFRNFYGRRAVRIFPLYYLFLLLYFLAVVKLRLVDFGSEKTLAAGRDLHWLWWYGTNLRIAQTGQFITASINHFWTLAVEEHFYLIWPLLIYFFAPRQLLKAVAAIAVGALVLRFVLRMEGVSGLVTLTLTPCRVDSFAIAGAAGVADMVPAWREPVQRFARTALLPTLIAALVMAYIGGLGEDTFGFTAIAIAFSMLIVCVTRPGRLRRASSARFLTTVGKYSYGLYVFHWPIQIGVTRKLPLPVLMSWTHSLVLAILLNMLLVGLLASAAAFVSWNLVEKHFLTLKRFFPESTVRPLIVPREHSSRTLLS